MKNDENRIESALICPKCNSIISISVDTIVPLLSNVVEFNCHCEHCDARWRVIGTLSEWNVVQDPTQSPVSITE